MDRRALFLCFVALIASAADDGTAIFTGSDLTGWDGDPRFWTVEDGAIVGRTTPDLPTAGNTFLIWRDGEVDDFELTASYRIEGGNSGIQYRSADLGGWVISGYQADIEDGDEWSGCLYEERGRGVLAPRGARITIGADGAAQNPEAIADKAALMKAIDRAGWNRYRITARGNRLTHAINDVVMSEVIDEQPDKRRRTGALALQLHAGPPMTVRFKDIRLRRLPLEAAKKIVLVAGDPSHADGEHEFPAGVHCLRRCLDGVPGVVAADYYHGWPADPTAYDNADAVLFYMDGGGGHPMIQEKRLATLGALMKRGVGMACVHYACEVPADRGGSELMDWIGGYYESGWSINPHWDAAFTAFPEHPITRGVAPFTITDEWYYNMRFRDAQDRVTAILSATPPDATRGTDESKRHPGRSEITSWAAERADGGRGFGFTGGHFHRNWAQADFRRLVLNALLWVAHAEVPAGGVESAPNDDDLNGRLRNRRAAQAAPAGEADAAGAAYASPVVREGIVDIDVDLAGAEGLWLVVSDGGNGFGCDWADWIEPRIITGTGEVKLTDLAWTEARTGWGEAQIGKNCNGGPLRVGGKPVANGIGVHANSLLRYDLPPGAERFVARAGLDNGGTDQNGGASVRFLVFTATPNIKAPRPSGAQSPDGTLEQMHVADGCAVGLFAHEPQLTNPTNIDVDHRGRVWVTEGMNYRQWGTLRPEGDRIVILEDADHDGTAEKSTVFYQGKDIDSALGICVLGDRVIVSRSPNVIVFTDADGDDVPEKKEILFAGIGGEQHDHGMHAVVFGPDGKLYFNFGNNGSRLGAANDGADIRDRAGNIVNDRGEPYRQGMVFRCDLDGTNLETLGWNFRNNYEVCVDSFGTLWQSDNDDDGNQGVRINYVMEYGNFGYVDEFTGAGWNDDRTGIEADIPRRHWHLDDPGVVPNLLQTGGGSPTGICVYEGALLPATFRGQLIHTDAGPNTCRSYPVTPDGAGWNATMVDVLTADDSWYRPSDACVGPDGSLYVADWYDPGVGGHNMGDNQPPTMRGRIYRVAPTGHRPEAPAVDVATPAGAVAALRSPNQAARFIAWRALAAFGVAAQPALQTLWADPDPRLRARALWLLAALPDQAQRWIDAAATEQDADLRVVAVRIARQRGDDVVALAERLADDPSAHVRRECAIALRFADAARAAPVWARLAQRHEAGDRWSLEALGIGAALNEEACFAAWIAAAGENRSSPAAREVIWRSRAAAALPYKGALIADPATPADERLRLFRSLDFHRGQDQAKRALLLTLLVGEQRDPVIAQEAAKRLGGQIDGAAALKAIDGMLDASQDDEAFVQLVDQLDRKDRLPQVLTIAVAHAGDSLGARAARLLLRHGHDLLRGALTGEAATAQAIAGALGASGEAHAVDLLTATARDAQRPVEVRAAAVRALALSEAGASALLALGRDGALGPDLKAVASRAFTAIPWRELRHQAADVFPAPAGMGGQLPPIVQLVAETGDPARGKTVNDSLCIACHVVGAQGVDFGPALTEIGAKLGKDALFEAILFPDAGIAHGFTTSELTLKDGTVVVGIVVSDTAAGTSLKTAGGIVTPYAKADVAQRRELATSQMPTGLQAGMSRQQLVDLVAYLATLGKK